MGEFLFGVDLPSEPEAIAALMSLREQFEGRFVLRRFASPKSRYFHSKLWLFEAKDVTAIVGSSNLTGWGLTKNYEANVLVTGTPAVDFGSYFEELFEGAYAHNVTRRWLSAYREIWNERRENVEKARRLRAKVLRTKPEPRPRSVPRQIKGHKFVFTGRIVDWPRDRKLYPYVRRLGGEIGPKSSAIPGAAAVVQGETMGGRETEKLKVARQLRALILTEQEFFDIAERQARRKR